MNKTQFVQMFVKQNDIDLSKIESRLQEHVDILYQKAVAKAIEEFRRLEKVGDAEVESSVVQKILDDVIKEFKSEFDKLVNPVQEESVKAYEDGLQETSILLAIGEKEEPKKKRGRPKKKEKK